jgi:hypothetical protein
MYDSAFRQQMASRGDGNFASLNLDNHPGIWGRGKICGTCMMSDHAQEECTLNPPPNNIDQGAGRPEGHLKHRK